MSLFADGTMAVLTALMLALLVTGAGAGSRLAGDSHAAARLRALRTLLMLAAWLAIASALSVSGVVSDWSARPPRWPLLPLGAFVAIALTMRSRTATRVLLAIPPSWPIAAQGFRIAVELALYALHEAGRAPEQITFAGRNFDVFVGLSAPVIAWLVATQRIGPRGAVLWNVAGLAVLANTVGTVISSAPGPLHADWPGAPLTAITDWPIVWLPAFLMPVAVFLHALSLRQSARRLSSPGACR